MLETRERQHLRDEIESRLQGLRADAVSSGEPFSEASLHDFREFLDPLPLAKRPAVFLLDNGNLRALWKNDAKEQIGLQFLGKGQVQYVMFSQPRRVQQMARQAGVQALSAIRAFIATNELEHLLFE